MRKLPTNEGIQHPKADVNRPYIKRQNGGRGLVKLESTCNASVVGVVKQGKDRHTRLMPEYDAGKAEYCLLKETNLIEQKYMTKETAVQNIKNLLKSSIANKKIEAVKSKSMHGQIYQDLERPSGDKEKSLAWLCSSGLKGETESLIIAAQDQTLNTHCYHQRNIMKQPIDSKCRMSCKAQGHIKPIVAGCTTLAPS
jgi:hypothetical protein